MRFKNTRPLTGARAGPPEETFRRGRQSQRGCRLPAWPKVPRWIRASFIDRSSSSGFCRFASICPRTIIPSASSHRTEVPSAVAARFPFKLLMGRVRPSSNRGMRIDLELFIAAALWNHRQPFGREQINPSPNQAQLADTGGRIAKRVIDHLCAFSFSVNQPPVIHRGQSNAASNSRYDSD